MLSSASVTVERTLPCGVSSLGSFGARRRRVHDELVVLLAVLGVELLALDDLGHLVVPLLLDRGRLDVRGAHDRLDVRRLRRLGALGLRLQARELGGGALDAPRRRAHALGRRPDHAGDRRAGQQHEAGDEQEDEDDVRADLLEQRARDPEEALADRAAVVAEPARRLEGRVARRVVRAQAERAGGQAEHQRRQQHEAAGLERPDGSGSIGPTTSTAPAANSAIGTR